MKKPVHRKAYSYVNKKGKTVHVPECTYFLDCTPKEKVGAGKEYENTVLDRDAWDKKEAAYQGSFPKMTITQRRIKSVTDFFENRSDFSAHELNRILWSKKTAPVETVNKKTYSWVKRILPQYLDRLNQHPEFAKFNK